MVFCWLSRGRGKEEQEEKEQEEKEQEEEEQRKFKTFNLERLPINDDHYRSFSSSQTPSPCTRHRGVHSADDRSFPYFSFIFPNPSDIEI